MTGDLAYGGPEARALKERPSLSRAGGRERQTGAQALISLAGEPVGQIRAPDDTRRRRWTRTSRGSRADMTRQGAIPSAPSSRCVSQPGLRQLDATAACISPLFAAGLMQRLITQMYFPARSTTILINP